jgi:hypothetical protein
MISIYILYPVPKSMPLDYIAPKDVPHYIGSTKNCAARLRKHLNSFKHEQNGTGSMRHCTSNQAIIGADFMCLEVLEKCEENERYIRERHWLNHYKNEGYNVVNKNNPNRTKEEYNEYMRLYMRNYVRKGGN